MEQSAAVPPTAVWSSPVATGTERLLVDGVERAPLLLADTPATRLRGMLGRRPLPPALLLRPANSVHGVGMHASLDVALLADDQRVVRVLRLRPFGMTRPRRGVRSVLEAPAGSFRAWGLSAGSRIEIVDGMQS
jgi:uncharacterized membrane protein (UPF0127 family)